MNSVISNLKSDENFDKVFEKKYTQDMQLKEGKMVYYSEYIHTVPITPKAEGFIADPFCHNYDKDHWLKHHEYNDSTFRDTDPRISNLFDSYVDRPHLSTFLQIQR